jgi:ribosomal-protein-alanine N-acetyltransferase
MNFHLNTERLKIKPISILNIEDVYQLQSLEETAKYNTAGFRKI